jgi:hypothetical protein
MFDGVEIIELESFGADLIFTTTPSSPSASLACPAQKPLTFSVSLAMIQTTTLTSPQTRRCGRGVSVSAVAGSRQKWWPVFEK